MKARIHDGRVNVLTKAVLISDEPIFYTYIEKISDLFFNRIGIIIDNVHKFLIIIHKDLSVDIYINNFMIVLLYNERRKNRHRIFLRADQ